MVAGRSIAAAVWLVLAFFVVMNNLQSACAMRVLKGEDLWVNKHHNMLVESLPRGRLPSSGANPCTRIPGARRGRCTLEGRKPERPAVAATKNPKLPITMLAHYSQHH
nr:hypothetical protein A4A49_38953 [Ipomoea batatas]